MRALDIYTSSATGKTCNGHDEHCDDGNRKPIRHDRRPAVCRVYKTVEGRERERSDLTQQPEQSWPVPSRNEGDERDDDGDRAEYEAGKEQPFREVKPDQVGRLLVRNIRQEREKEAGDRERQEEAVDSIG